jgi:hypothetical protein
MKKLMSVLCASSLAATMAVTGVAPVAAAPVAVPLASDAPANLHQVQLTNREIRRLRRLERREDRLERRADRIDDRQRRIIRRNDGYYYNGYRGYREYRRGYRRHGDFWFPAAAFVAGALITGAITNSRPRTVIVERDGYGSAHVEWCYNRYRSYRASDNTFQPYNGPRQQCYSPYD